MTNSIPFFTNQLKKSREATDLANIRAAYAEVIVESLDADGEAGEATMLKMVSTGAIDILTSENTIGKI